MPAEAERVAPANRVRQVAETSEQIELLIEGTLDQLLFVNEKSGYAVAVLERSDEDLRRRVTVVGSLAGLDVGAGLRLRGRFERHPKYGEQFRVEDFETVRPASVAALERYLAGEIKGVGPALARRIAEHFGEALPAVLDETPERLREVRGLGAVVAARIAAAWRDSSGLRELTVFLRGNGIAAGHARRIHKMYGRDSLETVRRDPYVLARTIAGIGFRTADMVAEKLGIPKNSIQRARAAVVFLLERMAEEGHVFAPFGYLEHQFGAALEMDPQLAAQAVEELVETGELVAEDLGGDGNRAIYLRRLHDAETAVAERMRRLTQGRPMGRAVVERAMEAAASAGGVELSAEQRSALRCALQSKVTVITGGPGTGKTTLLRSLLAALSSAGVKATLAAPTGRAARRLAEACGREAKTIHRLLEYSPETGGFIRGEAFPLRTTWLVIDEASMMDLELAASLLARAAARLLAAAGRRPRPVALGRSGQRAQGRDRLGAGAGGRAEPDLSPGAREPDRRQRSSAQPRRDARDRQRSRGRFLFLRARRARRRGRDHQATGAASPARRPLRAARPARNPGARADESRAARRPCAQP